MFATGQSGNPGGRKREKLWREALMRALARSDDGRPDGDPKALERLAARVVEMAMTGDMIAVKEIADRIDGKVAQTTILQGDEEGGPVQISRIEYVIVDPKELPTVIDGEVKQLG